MFKTYQVEKQVFLSMALLISAVKACTLILQRDVEVGITAGCSLLSFLTFRFFTSWLSSKMYQTHREENQTHRYIKQTLLQKLKEEGNTS